MRIDYQKKGWAVLLFGMIAWGWQNAEAQVVYSSGHGDLGIAYEEGGLVPHWHLDDGGEYEPSGVVAQVSSSGFSPAGSGPVLGLAGGSLLWLAGSAAHQPNLGFGAEELEPSDWIGESVEVSLTGFSGPGEFALYTTNLSGTSFVDVSLSSFNAASTFGGNRFDLYAGDHQHFVFGFTAPGFYEIELTWSGTHTTDGIQSASGIFAFNVIPEPSSYALAGLGAILAALAAVKRRGRRHEQA